MMKKTIGTKEKGDKMSDIRCLTTLCYIEQEGKYLMMHRISKKNDVNHDKWIGVGGHFKEGESPEECLIREVKEETGLTLTSYQFRGIVTFQSDEYPAEYMHLYTAWADVSLDQTYDCEEGKLEWIDKKAVCDLPIWEGDKIFFRLLNEGQPFFSLKLTYRKDHLVEAVLNGVTDLLK